MKSNESRLHFLIHHTFHSHLDHFNKAALDGFDLRILLSCAILNVNYQISLLASLLIEFVLLYF